MAFVQMVHVNEQVQINDLLIWVAVLFLLSQTLLITVFVSVTLVSCFLGLLDRYIYSSVNLSVQTEANY